MSQPRKCKINGENLEISIAPIGKARSAWRATFLNLDTKDSYRPIRIRARSEEDAFDKAKLRLRVRLHEMMWGKAKHGNED